MPTPRKLVLSLVAVVAATAFVVGACSSDDSSDAKKTTTTEKSDSGKKSDTDETTQAPRPTVDDAEFKSQMDKARSSLKGAGDDPCKVMETFQSVGAGLGDPSTPAQRKEATLLAVDFYKALADAAPDDLSSEADQVRTSVDAILKEGEDSNWSEDFFNSPEAVKDDKFNAATTKILEAFTTKCAPTTTAP